MKNLIVCIILLFIIVILWCLTSCTRYCDPANIKSGKSNQHHDAKPFKAKITEAKQYGRWCKIKYVNMKTIGYTVCECNCKEVKLGSWQAFTK